MIGYFKKSRILAWAGGVLSAIGGFLAAFVLLANRLSGIQRIGASVLVSFFAVNAVLCIARLVAVREYQDRLCLLYTDLNPSSFLDVLLPLSKIKTDIVSHTTTLVHIANGYLAAGEFQKAQGILQSIVLPDKAVELRGRVLSNLIACCLQQANGKMAEKTMSELKQLLRDKRCKPEFAKKARHALGYQTICLNILLGRETDASVLEQDFKSSKNALHRVHIKLQLARIYCRRGELNEFKAARTYVLDHGEHLYLSQLARSM